MHPKQREVIDLINTYKLADAFAALDELVLNNAVYSQIKKTYLTGKTDVDFTDRLLVFVQQLDVKENPTMPDHKAHLKKLARLGNIGRAIEELCDATEENGQKELNNNLLNLSGRYHRNDSSMRQGVITNGYHDTQLAKLTESLNYYIEEYRPTGNFKFEPLDFAPMPEPAQPPTSSPAPPPPVNDPPAAAKKVFISYSTKDADIAKRIKKRLEAEQLDVTIDAEDFQPGKNLTESIQQHLSKNEVIVSLVSENSLKSAWVAKESIILLQEEKMHYKLFLTVLLDNMVFDNNFINTVEEDQQAIKQQLSKEMIERLNKGLNIHHLSDEFDRRSDLIHHFSKIIHRFRENLAVDISGDLFDAGMNRIMKRIHEFK